MTRFSSSSRGSTSAIWGSPSPQQAEPRTRCEPRTRNGRTSCSVTSSCRRSTGSSCVSSFVARRALRRCRSCSCPVNMGPRRTRTWPGASARMRSSSERLIAHRSSRPSSRRSRRARPQPRKRRLKRSNSSTRASSFTSSNGRWRPPQASHNAAPFRRRSSRCSVASPTR